MKLEDMPEEDQEWVRSLSDGSLHVYSGVISRIRQSKTITTAKQLIIADMAHMVAECNDVILHVNAIETPKECTCAENCGDEL